MSHLVRKNDRREVRRAVKLRCQIVREKDFSLVADHVLDLSPDGMLVPTDRAIEKGENLLVTFRATNLDLWFDTEARVVRVERGRRHGDKARGVGIRFSTLDPIKRFILRGHLRRVPPPVPRRTQRIDWTATVRGIGGR